MEGSQQRLAGYRKGKGRGATAPPPLPATRKKSKACKRKPKGGKAPKDTPSGNNHPVINGQQMVPLAQVQAMITTAVANVFSQLIQ